VREASAAGKIEQLMENTGGTLDEVVALPRAKGCIKVSVHPKGYFENFTLLISAPRPCYN